MISSEDIAYLAGLFDGEGSIYFAKRIEKKKKHKGKGYRESMSQRISMEVTMTDESVIRWMHEVLGVGTVNKKPRKGRRKDGTKYLMQYKWRCTFRDAYYVCSPAIMFKSVDFPQPEGPKSTKKFPSSISKLIFFRTSVEPKFFDKFSIFNVFIFILSLLLKLIL